MNDIGVIFTHFTKDPIVRFHLNTLRKHNPDVPVACISGNRHCVFDNGHFMGDMGKLGVDWAETTKNGENGKAAQFNCDMMMMAAVEPQNKVACHYWIMIEHDTFCNTSLRSIYKNAFGKDVCSSYVKEPTEPWHHWGTNLGGLPEDLKQYACALIPGNGVWVSANALKDFRDLFFKHEIRNVFCEARLGTLARSRGINPHPLWMAHNKATPVVFTSAPTPGFWHPVKTLLSDTI